MYGNKDIFLNIYDLGLILLFFFSNILFISW